MGELDKPEAYEKKKSEESIIAVASHRFLLDSFGTCLQSVLNRIRRYCVALSQCFAFDDSR